MSRNATRPRPPQRRTSPAPNRKGAPGKAATRKAPARTAMARASVALAPRGHKRPYVLLAVILVVLALVWLIMFSSVLGVKRVGVNGASVVSVADVRAAAGIKADAPLATLDTDTVKSKVEAISAVASASVSRSWPNGVVITIHERQPIAVVEVNGEKWAVDITGKPYLPEANLAGGTANGLLPLTVDKPGTGDPATRMAVKVIASLPSALYKQVSSVTAKTGADVTLQLKDGRSIIWGSNDKAKEKATMIDKLLKHDGTEFDISSPQSVVIR